MFLCSIKKISLILACVTMIISLNAVTKTKKLQVMINPMGSDFMFYLNAGAGLVTNPSATRPAGSYVLFGAPLFPGGTMSKNQSSFLVDRHGNPLSVADSIGWWQAFEKMLVTVDNSNLPPSGTRIMMSEWALFFNKECHDKQNSIFLLGSADIKTLAFNEVFIEWILSVVSGLGCNDDIDGSATAKLYVAPDGTSLIKIKFTEEVKYN